MILYTEMTNGWEQWTEIKEFRAYEGEEGIGFIPNDGELVHSKVEEYERILLLSDNNQVLKTLKWEEAHDQRVEKYIVIARHGR